MAARSALERFAPISSGSTTRLRVAAGYFTLSGATHLVMLATALALAAGGYADLSLRSVNLLGVVISVSFGVVFLWIGALLRQRARLGALLGAATFLPALVARLVGQSVSTSSLVLAGIGAVVLVSVWSELTPGRLWPAHAE